MKVLIVGGPKDGKVFTVESETYEMRFAVLDPKFFPLDPSDALGIRSSFETVVNRFFRYVVSLPNGKECTLVLAVTEEAMENMDIQKWLELMSTALKEGCVL